MHFSPSEIYRLKVHQLKEECSKLGLDSTGPVQLLRQRLVQQPKIAAMADDQDNENLKASVSTGLSLDPTRTETSNFGG